MQVNGLANYNPSGATTKIQLAMSKALPDLTNGSLDNLWAEGVDGSGGVELGPVTQESTSDDSAYDLSDLLEGEDLSQGAAPIYYYDVDVPSSDLISGSDSILLSLESADSRRISATSTQALKL